MILKEFIGAECLTGVTFFSHETQLQYFCHNIQRDGTKNFTIGTFVFQAMFRLFVNKTAQNRSHDFNFHHTLVVNICCWLGLVLQCIPHDTVEYGTALTFCKWHAAYRVRLKCLWSRNAQNTFLTVKPHTHV